MAFVCLAVVAPVSAAAQPWMGIAVEQGRRGVRVSEVTPGSPAARAGLTLGDEIIAVDNQRVADPEALISMVAVADVGARLKLSLVGRRGRRQVQVVLAARPSAAALARAALIDKPAPDFSPQMVAGGPLARLSAWRGHVVLLDFFATWCPPCRAAMPRLAALHTRYHDAGLRILGISDEDPAVLSEARSRLHLDYALASDLGQHIAAQYQVYALPTVVVIDKAGAVRLVSVRELDDAERLVEDLLAAP